MPDINIAWWNLENLFDREGASRPQSLADRIGKELLGWTAAIRDKKLDQLASIISQLFGGAGPDLLGVCEVESEAVLQLLVDRMNQDLPNRTYRISHHNSQDARGIDTSLVFDQKMLSRKERDFVMIQKRRATRDLFWTRFETKQGSNAFVAIAAHWPSRSGGQYASQPFRMMAGETTSFLMEQLRAQFGADIPMVLMGDFNDEPFDRSMQEYLLGSRDVGRVRAAKNPMALNLMWPLMFSDQSNVNPGTYLYKSDWNMLDQFLVNKPLVGTSGFRADRNSATIFTPPEMQVGSSKKPRRFGRGYCQELWMAI